MKILFLENHARFAQTAARQFLAAHHVTITPSLSGARSLLEAESFDLVLSDYDLDDGKGDAFVRECRAARPQLPIIGVSSHDAGNHALLQAGAYAICGTMEFDRIAAVINRVLGDRHTSL